MVVYNPIDLYNISNALHGVRILDSAQTEQCVGFKMIILS